MNNTLRRISILAGILFAGTALAGYVRESFDGTADNTAVSTLPGWTASDSSVKVTNVGVVAHSTNNVLVVPIGKIVTNTVSVSVGVSNVVWTDFWTIPRPIGEVPDLDTNATAQFFVSNGWWVVYCTSNGVNRTNSYTGLNLYNAQIADVTNNGTSWQHVSVCQDYSNKLWHLFVEGAPIATNLGFINQSVSNYEWFVVQNRDSDSSSNMTLLDDVLITNAVPSSLIADSAGGTTNGLRDAWELMYYGHLYSGITSNAAAVVRSDGWTLAQLGSVGAPPVNPPPLVEYLFGGSTQSILMATASNNIRLTLATVPDRTNTILRTTDPNEVYSPIAQFYTGASGESNSWTDAPGTLTNGGRVFYRVVSAVPGTSVVRTNDQIFALYQQLRVQANNSNRYYAVGIPVNYGASNALNSTLGHDLATGLRGDGTKTDADELQLYNPVRRFYLNGSGSWRNWGDNSEATATIGAGEGILIRTKGVGSWTSGYGSTVFSGNKQTNTSVTVSSLTAGSMHMLSWPFDNTTANWTNSLSPAGHGTVVVADADAIWLLENGRFTARMILKTDGWYYDFPNGGTKVTTATFNPGQGFFYHNKGGEFSWTAVAP